MIITLRNRLVRNNVGENMEDNTVTKDDGWGQIDTSQSESKEKEDKYKAELKYWKEKQKKKKLNQKNNLMKLKIQILKEHKIEYVSQFVKEKKRKKKLPDFQLINKNLKED